MLSVCQIGFLASCLTVGCSGLSAQAPAIAPEEARNRRVEQIVVSPSRDETSAESASPLSAIPMPSAGQPCSHLDAFSADCKPKFEGWFAVERMSGRVVLGGGESPPAGARVVLHCEGEARAEGPAQPSGYFGFKPQLHPDLAARVKSAGGQPDGLIRLAVNEAEYMPPCAVSATLEGYLSDFVPAGHIWGDRFTLVAHHPRIELGTVILRPLEGFPRSPASATTAQAPEEARNAFGSGLKALRKDWPDFQRAQSRFERAVEAYPGFAAAWHALGETRWELGNEGGAMQAFIRSVNADAAFLPPYQRLIRIEMTDQNWEEVEWLTERYLALSPEAPMILYMSAAAAANLGNLDLAEERVSALAALGEMDRWPKSHAVLGLVQEGRLEYARAAKAYAAYLSLSKDRALADLVTRKLYEWRKLRVIASSDAGTVPAR